MASQFRFTRNLSAATPVRISPFVQQLQGVCVPDKAAEAPLTLRATYCWCIQDYCGCMPIDCPSSEAKPIDLVEAANGQANLPNNLGYAL